MEKPYLSEVINYEQDIAPYGFIQIFSGVGSGKNYFINKLSSGYTDTRADGSTYEVKPKSVLLITSRRAKVNELLSENDLELGSYILEWDSNSPIEDVDLYLAKGKTLPDLDGLGESHIHQRSIACTNAAIEKFLQKHYLPLSADSHLWQRFDFIVLDEAHSVLADASYQTAPFYVYQLINKAIAEYNAGNSTCKVIVMTGTPRVLADFTQSNSSHTMDLMSICRSVVPKQIAFVDAQNARANLLQRVKKGERVIYFANHIQTVLRLYQKLPQEIRDVTAMSFSDRDRLDMTDPIHDSLLERMDAVEKALSETQKLPQDVRLLLTTGKNKEGINIGDDDIKTMYVEAHTEIDVIQMAGRVREGLDVLYIIKNARGFGNRYSQHELCFAAQEVPVHCFDTVVPEGVQLQMGLVDYINEYFNDLCNCCGIDLAEVFRKSTYRYEPLADFVEYVHNKFPYILFDYFTDRFAFYTNRQKSVSYLEEQNNRFDAAKNDDGDLMALAEEWYAEAIAGQQDSIKEQLDAYLAEKDLLNKPYDKQTRQEIREWFSSILGKSVSSLNPVLNLYGYREARCSQNKDSLTFGMNKIVRL